jgi:hypothetical protein
MSPRQSEAVEIKGRSLHCVVCHNATFWRRTATVYSGVASFFELEWLSPSAVVFVCDNCGYVHWFFPTE